jgi:serine/threonine protein kinase
MLWDEKDATYHSYTHFSQWPEVKDEAFKDLIMSMARLDPVSRITALQALQHPWFREVELR